MRFQFTGALYNTDQDKGVSRMTALPRRNLLLSGAALSAAAALGPSPLAAAQPVTVSRHRVDRGISRRTIHRWAADTWASLVAMTDEKTGLTADNIEGPLGNPTRSGYTSPTNIGGYLWSAIVAREMGIISARECTRRLRQTMKTLKRMAHHGPSGMYYNWYDERDGSVLRKWPTDGNVVYPFLSSVDNGWLAAALMVVENADPAVARLARSISEPMTFAAYYDPHPDPIDGREFVSGLLHGGFWDEQPPGAHKPGNYLGVGPDVYYTLNHYDTTVSETRIASYIAIARGQVPAAHYFATFRTFPRGKYFSWQEQRPVGTTRHYLGLPVFEGAYQYRGMRIVPGWGGSMFEALMPNMFVPEESWGPRSWGVNHPLTVRAHREHGLDDAKYGFWGFSPASRPGGGYSEWGVDAIGLNSGGYPSDMEHTNYDIGYPDYRPASNPNPNYGDGVITPHALFLAMHHEPRAAYRNLIKVRDELEAYGDGGFYDAIAVKSGVVARRYLSLDQAMIMGSIGNVFADRMIQRAFCRGAIRRSIKPLLALERFSAG
jgi:hypothetical protein